MLKIRLRRIGKKKQPFYRIVVADKDSPVKGKFVEIIGTYNPLTDPKKIEVKVDRLKYWLEKGARPSDTVNNLLVKIDYFKKSQVIKKTVTKKRKKKKEKEEKPEKPTQIPVPESQAKEQPGGLLENTEEIEEKIEEAKAEEAEKQEIAEKVEEVKQAEQTKGGKPADESEKNQPKILKPKNQPIKTNLNS